MVAQGDSRLVLTTGLDTCLVAYPMAEWLAFEKRLSRAGFAVSRQRPGRGGRRHVVYLARAPGPGRG